MKVSVAIDTVRGKDVAIVSAVQWNAIASVVAALVMQQQGAFREDLRTALAAGGVTVTE